MSTETLVDTPPTRQRPWHALRARLSADDRSALGVWLLTRVAVALLALGGARSLAAGPADAVEPFLARWDRWDATRFRLIAEFGYTGFPDRHPYEHQEAFFPGFPLVVRAVHVVVPDYRAAALVVALVAGCVAAVALSRLAQLEGVRGSRAVLYLTLSPYAVFLAAGYSEALFLALALPAWLCAKREHWVAAGLLVGLSASVRITGAFLAVGLAVEYLVAHRGRLRWDAVALLAPAVAVGGYFLYLHALTGDWLRWFHAQEGGWQRQTTAPWTAFRTTLDAARNTGQSADFLWAWRAEILAVLVGLVLTGVLLAKQRWGEAVYVGLSVAALSTSTYYLSVARASLLWWPLFLLLAAAAARRPWVHTAYLACSAPLMAVLVLTFTAGRWVD